ncbi:MAG: hypothetical protein QXJ72_06795 [Thermoproteota archaeon]
MSWIEMVRKTVKPFNVSFTTSRGGNPIVKPLNYPNLSLMFLVRRMQFSFEMKFESVCILDIEKDWSGRDLTGILMKMLAESVELEAKGVLRKKIEIRRWSELDQMSKFFKIPQGGELISFLKSKNIENILEKGAFELIEVFPKLMPDEILEYYFMTSGKHLMVDRMIQDYVESPQKISWIIRLHSMYGFPGSSRIKKGYLSLIRLAEKIEEFTDTSLAP